MDAFHVKSVDTTGAGDSFVGALLTKVVDDHSILEVHASLNLINFWFGKTFMNRQIGKSIVDGNCRMRED